MEEQQGAKAKASPVPSPKAERASELERQRRLQGLQMQRERVLSERTSNPHRRSALELALVDIERELEQLGWTIHI